ncbi:MAG: hypothetical protein M1450_05400 [Patescibacteria group bacterium]|nr:hypothetical protein [Patescibacteria group bacterium]
MSVEQILLNIALGLFIILALIFIFTVIVILKTIVSLKSSIKSARNTSYGKILRELIGPEILTIILSVLGFIFKKKDPR